MSNYQYMHPSGKTVMRISATLITVVLCVLLVSVYLINYLWLNWFAQETMKWVLMIGVGLILLYAIIELIIVPKYRYKIFKYHLENHTITVRNGLWFVKVVKIPLFRIQNVDTHEGILMRKYQLVSLTLSTAGGNTEIKLINKDVAATLKQTIKQVNQDRDIENINE
ncbi:PH domain-containing protein [Staphylococcus sp. GSSP0090]|nr:PH domain-containing protein [Staphylococcus sp. GSSP0090]